MTDAAELAHDVAEALEGRNPAIPDVVAELAFLEIAMGELVFLWRTHPNRAPAGLSSIPRLVTLLELHGSRMVIPLGPAVLLAPSPAWQLDPATGDYITPIEQETAP